MLNPDQFRAYYDYHFRANRKLWDEAIMTLTDAQYLQKLPYSVGSIRNQMVHLMNIEDRWFSGLRGVEVPGLINPVYIHTRDKLREKWDVVEATIREYLANLTDAEINREYDAPFLVWQVLLHVVNHATDHRAQTLAMLHQMGAPTFGQDYAYFIIEKL